MLNVMSITTINHPQFCL